jgi:excinuclease UvrABC nuclease subunit
VEQDKDKKIAELEAQVAELETKVTNLEAENAQITADSEKVINDLTEKLKIEGKKAKSADIVVTHEKKKYRVVIGKFRHEGNEITAEELAKKPEVIAELVESKSSVLEKVD